MQRRMLDLKNINHRSDEDGNYILEGYFAKYNSEYKVFDDWIETIAPGAFDSALQSGSDVKVLWNHNSDIVLGSTAAGTATLKCDNIGLYGKVTINAKDSEAVNCYQRIARGDVNGCSFGFEIESKSVDYLEDGTIKTTLLKINPLYEVSPCTFPAYESTEIFARNRDDFNEIVNKHKKEEFERWKQRISNILKKPEV